MRRRVKQALREQLGIDARTVNVYIKSVKGRAGEGGRTHEAAPGAALEANTPFEDLDHEALRDLERRRRFDLDDEIGL